MNDCSAFEELQMQAVKVDQEMMQERCKKDAAQLAVSQNPRTKCVQQAGERMKQLARLCTGVPSCAAPTTSPASVERDFNPAIPQPPSPKSHPTHTAHCTQFCHRAADCETALPSAFFLVCTICLLLLFDDIRCDCGPQSSSR